MTLTLDEEWLIFQICCDINDYMLIQRFLNMYKIYARRL